MERAILNHLSTTAIVVLFVGGMVLLTVAGVLIARRLVPDLGESRFAEVVEGLRVVYELIFALILAFVIAAVLDAVGDAEATVATEATQIAQLQRVNDAFGDHDKLRLNGVLEGYVHALVGDEWKTMRDGRESPVATAALEAVYVEYRDMNPSGTVEQEAFSLALSKLDDIASERRNRLNLAAADLPTMLRVLVAIGIVLLLLLEYRPELSSGASLAFMGALAAIVTSAYLLTLVLNYPFAGDVSVSNDPLKRDRLAAFFNRELAYREDDGDRFVRLEPQQLRGTWNSNAFGTLVMRCYTRGDGPVRGDRIAPRECRQNDDWYGAYRYHDGVVTGRLDDDGVFRGRWSEKPERVENRKAATGDRADRQPTVDNGGAFAWRGVRRSGKTLIVGCRIYGRDGRNDPQRAYDVHPGWDLVALTTGGSGVAGTGAPDEPRDLAARFDDIGFTPPPRVPRTRPTVHDCAHHSVRSRPAGGGGQAVKVGGIFDLSGETAEIGTPYADGIKDFVSDYNEQGRKPEIELTSEDYRYDPANAGSLYSSLRKEGVVALQGWGTEDTQALSRRVAADGIPFMSASLAETLTRPSATPLNFVAATSYSDQMRIALRWISRQARGAEVASFHHARAFGTSPQDAGERMARQLGLGFERYPMADGAKDFGAQLRLARSRGARYVIIQNTSIPAARLARQIAALDADMKIVCLNWCADELFIELAGAAARGTVGVMPFAPATEPAGGLAAPRRFLSQRTRTLDQEGVHYVQGWYTMALMAQGIKRAADDGPVTGETIRQALEKMGPFDTDGISAPMDFTATSHAGMRKSRLYVVRDERWSRLTGLQNGS